MRNDLALAATIVPYKNRNAIGTVEPVICGSPISVPSRHSLQVYDDFPMLFGGTSQISLASRANAAIQSLPEISLPGGVQSRAVPIAVSYPQTLPVNRSCTITNSSSRPLLPAAKNDIDWAEVGRFVMDTGIKQYAQDEVLPFVQRRLDEEGISKNPAFIEAGNAIVANKDQIIEKVKQNPYVTQAVKDAKGVNLVGAVVNILASSEIEAASQEAAARAIMSGKVGVGTVFGCLRGNPESWGKLLGATIDTMANEDTEHNRKYIKFKDPFKIRFRK